MPTVSVIIPTYNRADSVCESIDSVLVQSCADFEVLVVDDGSTDHTGEVLAPYVRDGRIRLIRGEHRGAAAARNLGLAHACGEFIGFCDSDDLWVPNKLELQLSYFASHPHVDLVFGDIASYRDGRLETQSYFAERKPYAGRVFHKLFERNFVTNVTVLVRKPALTEIGGYDEKLKTSEDNDLWLRFSQRFQIGFVNPVLVKVRRHGGNLTSNADEAFANRLAVLKSIAAQKGNIPRRVIRRAYANIYRSMGYDRLHQRRAKDAKSALLESIRLNPWSLTSYKYLLATLFPVNVQH
ncbi:MAG: glycosyltransferase [Candidatus Omnitrophica bacterium]|nr:glycosyltransferase [Candidatus Omnitrophota bacterium]MDD5670475.1 glycosyltransferase [Candidatus Omnitrophota bacterium]